MDGVDGFDKGEFPLHAVAVATWEGFIFVNLATEPEPFERAFAPLSAEFARFNLPRSDRANGESTTTCRRTGS